MNAIIKLSDNAASRIKEIMSGVESNSIGVRVAVKSGGCAGMSYVMEYAKEVNPTDEIIEDKGVKVFVDAAAVMYLLGTEMDYKKEEFSSSFVFNNPMNLSVVAVVNPLKYNITKTHISIANITYLRY